MNCNIAILLTCDGIISPKWFLHQHRNPKYEKIHKSPQICANMSKKSKTCKGEIIHKLLSKSIFSIEFMTLHSFNPHLIFWKNIALQSSNFFVMTKKSKKSKRSINFHFSLIEEFLDRVNGILPMFMQQWEEVTVKHLTKCSNFECTAKCSKQKFDNLARSPLLILCEEI